MCTLSNSPRIIYIIVRIGIYRYTKLEIGQRILESEDISTLQVKLTIHYLQREVLSHSTTNSSPANKNWIES